MPKVEPDKKGKNIDKKSATFRVKNLSDYTAAKASGASEIFKKASDFQEKCQRLQRLLGIRRGKKISAKNEPVFFNFQKFSIQNHEITVFHREIKEIWPFLG